MWPYVSLNGQESICFYITLLDSRFWAQLPSTCQEIAPEIGPVVWVAYKPPRRYESKWKRRGKETAFTLPYIHHRRVSVRRSCLPPATGSQRRSTSHEGSKMEASVHFLWPQVHVWINPRSLLLSSLSVTQPLVFSRSLIAVNGFGFWYVLSALWEWMEEFEFHWSRHKNE